MASGTFTLTGALKHHDKVTPHVDSPLAIYAGSYPDTGDNVVYALGASVLTDASGQFSITLLTETDLWYRISSGAVPPLFDTITFAAPANGSTVDLSDLTTFDPGTITPTVLAQAIAASAAAIAAVATVAISTWQATTSVVAGQAKQAPDGSIILSNATRTTRASFDATEQTFWTVVFAKTGTLDQIAFDARLREAHSPNPSGDTSGATDTAAIAAALATMGKTAGLTRPAADPLVVELGAGPYYINAASINVAPGQALRSKAPGGTVVNCVGGTAGQAFISTTDPSFSTAGTDITSRGGQVSGLILDGALSGRGTVGVLRGDILNAHLDVTVLNFGGGVLATSATGTTAVVNGRSDTVTKTANSPVVADTSVAIADLGTAVTGTNIPAAAKVAALVKGVSFIMGDCAPAVANATGSGSISLQVGWLRTDTVTVTSGNNFVPDTSAAAGDLGSAVFGTNIPLGAIVMAVDPGVGLYLGKPNVAVLYQNTNGWCERCTDRIETFDCATHIAMDGTSTFKSFSYNKLRWTADIKHGQRGLQMRGGPQAYGVDWVFQGSVETRSTTNNGTVLSHSESSRVNGSVRVHFESVNVSGVTQCVPQHFADAGSGFRGYGAMNFMVTSPAPVFAATKTGIATLTAQGASQIAFRGFANNVWGIASSDTFGKAASTVAGYETKSLGASPVAGSTVTINWETGNLFKPAVLVASTAYTVVVDNTLAIGTGTAFEIRIIFQQASSGTAATISWASWPGTIFWKGGTAFQVDATLSSRSAVTLTTADGGATWYGAAA